MIKKIKTRQLQLRKNKDTMAKLYSILFSEVNTKAKNELREPYEADFLEGVKKLINSNKDCISDLSKISDNQEKIQELKLEIDELSQWMPRELQEDELKAIILGFIKTLENPSMKNMKDVMNFLKDNYLNQYNGKLTSSLVRGAL